MICILAIIILGSLIIYTTIIDSFNKIDNEIVLEKSKLKLVKISMYIVITVTIILFYFKYNMGIKFLFSVYLVVFLAIASTFDLLSYSVYSILNYITFVIAISYMLFNGAYEYSIISTILFAVLNFIFAKLKIYGGGDSELYVAIAPFISINYPNNLLEVLLLNIIIANIISIVINRKKFSIRKMRFNKQIAFVPYISLSTIIIQLVGCPF